MFNFCLTINYIWFICLRLIIIDFLIRIINNPTNLVFCGVSGITSLSELAFADMLSMGESIGIVAKTKGHVQLVKITDFPTYMHFMCDTRIEIMRHILSSSQTNVIPLPQTQLRRLNRPLQVTRLECCQ